MLKRPFRIAGLLLGLLGAAIFAWNAFSPEESFDPAETLVLATDAPGGTYEAYGRTLAAVLPLNLTIRNSPGSVANLELLRAGAVDYALVQSDIVQYFYRGERGQERFTDLRLVMPLFPEFVQILVPANSDVRVMGDLRGRRICLGEEGSGTFFNSVDILQEAGLRESIDYVAVTEPSIQCIEELSRGGSLEAAFVTSNRNYAQRFPGLRQLYLSNSAVSALVVRRPYFRSLPLVEDGRRAGSRLAVDAVLVTRAGESPAAVAVLTRQIVEHWPAVSGIVSNSYAPGERITGGAIPRHNAARGALIRMGIGREDYFFYIIAGGWMAVLILCLVAERKKNSYNRLGERSISALAHRFFVNQVGRVSQLVITLTGLALFFAVAVFLLVRVEDSYAQQVGTPSPFSTMGFSESILWLFTYIASGFTADGIYPITIPGKATVAILAILGLMAPVTIVMFLINRAHARAKRKLQGLGTADCAGHVVICGWNEKAPGVIYTLTGEDVDRKVRVILIADMQDNYPLERYNFNPRYVTYCRGDPSDSATLERANISKAGTVIILADFQSSGSHNKRCILTAMNVRRVNAKAHICAELEYADNVDLYQVADCNSLVYPGLIISRLATVTALNSYLLDYVMDVVTYHQFDELRSAAISELDPSGSLVGRELEEAGSELLARGVNPVGLVGRDKAELRDTIFGHAVRTDALLDPARRQEPLRADDILIYSAERAGLRNSLYQSAFEPLRELRFEIDYPKSLSLLICADAGTIAALNEGLESVYDDLRTDVIDIEKVHLRSIEQINELAPGSYDKAVILAPQSRRTELRCFEDLNEIDADLMLITRLLHKAFERRACDPEIICEVANIQNRVLLKSAGADVLLPALLASERFLSKEAYDRSNVADFLMDAMDLEDGIHLHCHAVRTGDGFCGELWSRILATPMAGMRILAWLPQGEQEMLTNAVGDYRYHFRTVIDHRLRSLTASEGDFIIAVVDRRQRKNRAAERVREELVSP